MTDAEFLLILLASFYLGECTFWIRPGMFVYASQLGEKARRVNLRWAFLRNHAGGLLLGNLFPFGRAFVSQQWPLSISPHGVYAYVAQAVSSDGRPFQTEKFVAFEDILRIESHGQDVIVNRALFARTASSHSARQQAALLRELASLPAEQREERLHQEIENHLAPAHVTERVAAFRSLTAELQVTCVLLFFLVLVVGPLLVWLMPPIAVLEPLLLSYISFVFLAMLQYHRAHKRLYPGARFERIKQMLIMLISPADAIHARDRLARPLLAGFHPLVVTKLLGRAESFRELAGCVWRDQLFPILPVCPVEEAGPAQTEAWFRERLKLAVEKFLVENGFTLEELAQPPRPDDAWSVTYCPRCLDQYVVPVAYCQACGDRPTVPL